MDGLSFEFLCDLMKGLERRTTVVRNAIPLRKRVAVGLYASFAEYRTISNMFGIGKSTVCAILREFCEEVWKVLRPKYMNTFPLTPQKIKENVDGFKKMGLHNALVLLMAVMSKYIQEQKMLWTILIIKDGIQLF